MDFNSVVAAIPWYGWLALLGGAFLLFFFWKASSEKGGMYKKLGAFLVFLFLVVAIVPPLMSSAGPGGGGNGGDEELTFRSGYEITWAVDATTPTISASFSQTDEVGTGGAGEYTIDNEARTITVPNTCAWGAVACTWDVFAFTQNVRRSDNSLWDEGARVTTVLRARFLPDNAGKSILEWGIASNNTAGSPIVKMVDQDAMGRYGLAWFDSAGTVGTLGNLDSGALNEYSPGESTTATELAFAINEDSLPISVPAVNIGNTWGIEFYDDYGFSQIWHLTIVLTTTA